MHFGEVHYPRQILLDRPQNDYQFHIGITKLTANDPLPRIASNSATIGNGTCAGGRKIQGASALIRYMILQNVLHRPIRTLITVIGVAVEVTLVIIVVGLTTGLLTESAKRTEGVGADIMVQPPSASVFMAFSGAPMPIAIGENWSNWNTCRRWHRCCCSSIR